MSKGTPAPPPPPDPNVVANAQTGTNIGTAVAQSTLNNTNQVSPLGDINYDQTGGYTDPSTGQFVPQYTATTTLGDLPNTLLQGQTDFTNTLMPVVQQATGQVNPLNVNQTANNSIIKAGPQALDPTVTNAVYNQQAGFLDPQWQQQQTNLQDQLARQGIPVGSDAYNNAMTQFNTAQSQAYNAAANSATAQGAQVAGQNFGLALQGQNQNLAQQQAQQTNPMQLLGSLTNLTGITTG